MKFNYQARNQKGEVQTGSIEASSKKNALSILQRHQLYVTYIEQESSQPFYAKKIDLFGRVNQKDIVIFSRQLSLMFDAKISLMESLQALGAQTKKRKLKETIMAIAEDVEGGTPFSVALARFPKLFSSFYINVIKAGEASGTLSKSLEYLAEHMEREYDLNSKVKGALTYPALIVAVVVGVLFLLMFFVIPNLATVLTANNQELPFLTRVVIGSSGFIRSWGWTILLAFIGLGILFYRYLKTQHGKENFDRFILKVPLVGKFMKLIYVTRFAENLSTLVKGGIPIIQALDISRGVVGNKVYKDILAETKEEVKRGEKISKVISKYPNQFPPLLVQMISVGERTATIDKSLMSVVSFYQKEVNRGIDELLKLLEPLLVMTLGLIVGGLMASVMMPLYQMSTV